MAFFNLEILIKSGNIVQLQDGCRGVFVLGRCVVFLSSFSIKSGI